jgi:hypothetical protein
MDFTFYRLLVQHLSPPPDLAPVKQQGQLLPEEWPVVLDKIVTYRKKIQHFTVSDGKTSIVCTSDVPDLYDRIATVEVGTIIHLLGARSVFSPQQRGYVANVEDFVTLKQYDEHLRQIREAEARRLADLHDELALYQYQHMGYGGDY